MNDRYDIIHLASDEWGNEKMKSIAQDHFAVTPDCDFVLVYEHAGWMLGYRRDLSIWGTANDQARLERPEPRPTGFSGRTIRRDHIKNPPPEA